MTTPSPEATSLLDHLLELRKRLSIALFSFIVISICLFPVADEIFRFLIQPLADLSGDQDARRLIYTHMTEAFLTQLKLCLFVGFCLSFPIMAYQVWAFVAPGLFGHEKKALAPYLILSPVLFFIGAAFAYYIIVPNAWAFFLSFETTAQATALPIELEARVEDYVSLMMQFALGFGLSFQLPLILITLGKMGILSKQSLKNARKYAFLGILIVSAFLTPPDVLSMLGLAAPLYLLYELSIFGVPASESN